MFLKMMFASILCFTSLIRCICMSESELPNKCANIGISKNFTWLKSVQKALEFWHIKGIVIDVFVDEGYKFQNMFYYSLLKRSKIYIF